MKSPIEPIDTAGLAVFLGFIAFSLGCSVGAIANIDVASWLYKAKQTWWVAGLAGRAAECCLELRGEHESHLATGSPQIRPNG